MKKSFVCGVSVEGSNFTDRGKETRHIKQDFETGQNVILNPTNEWTRPRS